MKGQIVEWNDAKGYGFISALNGEIKVFIHVSSVKGATRRPKLDDAVVFEVEEDNRGRLNAKQVVIQGAGGLSITVLFALGFLLMASVSIIVLKGLPFLVPAYFALSLLTFVIFWRDKQAAQKGQWRTPENTLHFLCLIGGWPGALLAQHYLRHKSKKQPFKLILWLAIILNISGFIWLFTGAGRELIQSLLLRL
ncbi:hypothetical protein A9264_02675 [Vibrio sp. UCD-FRSSP16_10]|uniref:DUF1294 domain-containing protein n=1 Tax=unclassified Vibrio TaxID=2614977 RepID=UPI0007FEF7DF|nr:MULTISPECIES: DUF1294 domain-containing protein [unclassified Vibrio]OBT12068.1 hypothetical protein A9260_04125 [Vibrio sp. UCD-FRSSP16_30]OBT20399.1 hypothetical protein A9264_02675 [Vibrio sp. UCD-FRSSP16_10]